MADPVAVSPNLIPASEPGGEFSLTQMIPTLVFDVAMPIAGAGGGYLARDGIRRDDRADRMDAAIYARDARTAHP